MQNIPDKSKRLLFVIGLASMGGAERVLSVLAKKFAESGNEVFIVCLDMHECQRSSAELTEGIEYIFIGQQSNVKHISYLHRWQRLRREIKRIKPDIIVGFMLIYAIQALISTMGMHIPVILRTANIPAYELSPRFVKGLTKLLLPKIRGAVFQTQSQQEGYLPYIGYSCKRIIIPNPAVGNPFWNDPKDYTNKTILNAGRLVEEKEQKLLINAFAEIADRFPEWNLVICGAGPLRDDLDREITRLNLKGRVEMPGFIKDIDKYMHESSIFALPSQFEGMPNVLIEAMCMGCACIVTDFHGGSATELIRNNHNGVIIPIGDREALSGALVKLMGSCELREQLGSQATYLRERQPIDEISERWLEFFGSIYSCG